MPCLELGEFYGFLISIEFADLSMALRLCHEGYSRTKYTSLLESLLVRRKPAISIYGSRSRLESESVSQEERHATVDCSNCISCLYFLRNLAYLQPLFSVKIWKISVITPKIVRTRFGLENPQLPTASPNASSTDGNHPCLSRLPSLMKPEYDVVIIGSGYGGGVAASRMARAGKSVCVLERGSEQWPRQYPQKFKDTMREYSVTGRLSGANANVSKSDRALPHGQRRRARCIPGPWYGWHELDQCWSISQARGEVIEREGVAERDKRGS
jgi:hypothetical protein